MQTEVMYDPQLDLATLVDLDTMRALGPIAPGQEGAQLLERFARDMPEVILELDTLPLTTAWVQYWQRNQPGPGAPPAAADTGTVGAGHDPGADAPAVATTAEGAPTDEPPAPAPVDTDPGAHPSSPPTVTNIAEPAAPAAAPTPAVTRPVEQQCPACEGRGMIQLAADEPSSPCNMCGGSGKITQQVAV